MNVDFFVENVKLYCKNKGLSPSKACRESGAGETLLDNIKRGRSPSIDRVQRLAIYLGVTTSELLGESASSQTAVETPPVYASRDGPEEKLLTLYRQLNQEGQEKLLDYADDLAASGKYKKSSTSGMGKEDLA